MHNLQRWGSQPGGVSQSSNVMCLTSTKSLMHLMPQDNAAPFIVLWGGSQPGGGSASQGGGQPARGGGPPHQRQRHVRDSIRPPIFTAQPKNHEIFVQVRNPHELDAMEASRTAAAEFLRA